MNRLMNLCLVVCLAGCGTVDNLKGEQLIQAADNGQLSRVKALLDQGVDVNFRQYDSGETALFGATTNGHRDVVKLLLKRGADVHIIDVDGRIAKDCAQTAEMKGLFK